MVDAEAPAEPDPASEVEQRPEPGPEPDDSLAQRVSIDLWESLSNGPASFTQLAQAHRIRSRTSDRFTADQLGRASRELVRAGRRWFAGRERALVAEYWCTVVYGGCARTQQDELLSVLNWRDDELVVMEQSILQTSRDATRVFGGPRHAEDRREVVDSLYSVLTRLMATADTLEQLQRDRGEATADPRRQLQLDQEGQKSLRGLRAEWLLCQQRTAILIQRQARFEYLVGVAVGVLAALVLLGGFGTVAALHWSGQILAPAFLAATVSGAIGALVSVIQRMAPDDAPGAVRHALTLDFTAPRNQRLVLGAARPFVGAAFAGVIYFGLMAGLLSMQGPDANGQDTPATFAMFGLLGFLSGFSERFATDFLERAGSALVKQDSAAALTSGQATTAYPMSSGGGVGVASTPEPAMGLSAAATEPSPTEGATPTH